MNQTSKAIIYFPARSVTFEVGQNGVKEIRVKASTKSIEITYSNGDITRIYGLPFQVEIPQIMQ